MKAMFVVVAFLLTAEGQVRVLSPSMWKCGVAVVKWGAEERSKL
jgi:hypothetical protein